MSRDQFVDDWMDEFLPVLFRGYTTKESDRGRAFTTMEWDAKILRDKLGQLYDRIQTALREHGEPPLPTSARKRTLEEMVASMYEFIEAAKKSRSEPPKNEAPAFPRIAHQAKEQA